MTDFQKNNIRRLRISGESYSGIADRLGLPEGTIKSFCRRNNLQITDIKKLKQQDKQICKNCGKPLIQKEKRKPKRFCSNECRLKWWNQNRDQVNKKGAHILVCSVCGIEFKSYDIGRKYCCQACYVSARFKKGVVYYDARAI